MAQNGSKVPKNRLVQSPTKNCANCRARPVLEPGPFYWTNKGYAYNMKGEWTHAIECADEVFRINPASADISKIKASACFGEMNWNWTINWSDQVLSLEPLNPLFWRLKGIAYDNQGGSISQQKAVECLEKSHEIEPNDPMTLQGLINALKHQKRNQLAAVYEKKLAELPRSDT